MGFVTKLLSFFIPVMIAIIFYHQRDHILSEQNNAFLDAQFEKIASQFNLHVDVIKEQLDQYVAEKKEIVGTVDDEVDLKERVIKPEEQFKTREVDESKDEVKIDQASVEAVVGEESNAKTDEQTIRPVETSSKRCDLGKDLLISKEQLANYNGEDSKKKIYLAFLGIVYDVSKGEQHYAPGGAYSMFTGKDASRAFITGDFSEAGLVDDLTGLKAESFNGVKEWADFYEKSYRRVGRLIGGFYDQNGCPTQQVHLVEQQLEKSNQESLDAQYENELFPPCNTEWNKAKKETRFWCTQQSGGVQRDWIGLPRQLLGLKNKNDYRCACVRDFGPETKNAIEYADEEDSSKVKKQENVGDLKNPRVREFDNCSPQATECVIKDQN